MRRLLQFRHHSSHILPVTLWPGCLMHSGWGK
uniref:Uncharacterized protein n=1 Tax=Anguilla anguilla TaxID=7936 RepID=A0A0E9VH27_ANGAN